jgi:hypothetical protein
MYDPYVEARSTRAMSGPGRTGQDGNFDAPDPLLPVASDGFLEANSCHLYVSAV